MSQGAAAAIVRTGSARMRTQRSGASVAPHMALTGPHRVVQLQC